MLRAEEIAARLAAVRERIERCDRDPETVAIVGVTKGQPAQICAAAVAAGIQMLGENRVQEALSKIGEVQGAEWHLVGHLQTNKVRLLADRFALLQSVDSPALVEEIARRQPGQRVLVQVNVAREPQKHGVAPEAAQAVLAAAAAALDLQGLMVMAPYGVPAFPVFEEARRLAVTAEQQLGCRLPILSMGMSDDFEAAVRAGSTMIRLGRVLFGTRR